jgi:signal recognition particle subunit SRP54
MTKTLIFGCSVAATKTPIIFLGVGEHLHDLDRFSPQPFISKLLGLGDMQGLMEHMQDLAIQNPDKQKEMAKKLEEGKLSIRDWREQISNVMNMYVFTLCMMYEFLTCVQIQGTNQQNCVNDSWTISRSSSGVRRRGRHANEADDLHY